MVYRLGFADSRAQARQIVMHGHISLSGRKTDVPSCLAKEGDTVSWTKQGAETEYYKQVAATIESKMIPGWLSLDKGTMVGTVASLPVPDDAEAKFDGKTVVEYYSR